MNNQIKMGISCFEIKNRKNCDLKKPENKKEETSNVKRIDIKDKNRITILYEVNNYHNRVWERVNLFGEYFVKTNRDKCKIIYKNKEYGLMEYFNINDIDKNEDYISIELTGIDKITNACSMFEECDSFITIPDISNWDTSNIQSMSYMFSKC